jgi:CPA2 family monovalent cation:H+ antiporter-2
VGVEKEFGNLMSPEAGMVLEDGDVVWVVGEKEDVYKLVNSDVCIR